MAVTREGGGGREGGVEEMGGEREGREKEIGQVPLVLVESCGNETVGRTLLRVS